MRPIAIAVLLAALLLAAPADAQGRAGARGRAAAAHDADAADFANVSATAREHGLDRAEQAHAFGRFALANGTATGRFVRFGLDATSGALGNFSVSGPNGMTSVFASVAPDAFSGNGTARVTGSVLHLDGASASFAAHNNPTANFDYSAGDANMTITLHLAQGVKVANFSGGGLRLDLGTTGIHAHLVTSPNGTLSLVDNATIVARVPANGSLFFLKHPTEGALVAHAHDVLSALVKGRVGAIDTIVGADGAPLEDRTFAGVLTRARNVSLGHADLVVSSDEHEGRSVVLNLDSSIFPAANASTLVVLLDGARIARAANAMDALNATNASAWFEATGDGVQVVVSVPEFSDHTLTIDSADTTTSPTPQTTSEATSTPSGTTPASATPAGKPAPGFEPALLVAGLSVAALLLARGRRRD